MNVIVLIGGREAIPVRAIPLVTNWNTSPYTIVRALAYKEGFTYLCGLSAYRLENGAVMPVKENWWERLLNGELLALHEEIKALELSKEDGRKLWREKALVLLPAGVFVWKDEFVRCYENGATTAAQLPVPQVGIAQNMTLH